MAKAIKKAQIMMIPGGFSAGDEPEGSGKFIATVLRNEKVREFFEHKGLSKYDGKDFYKAYMESQE